MSAGPAAGRGGQRHGQSHRPVAGRSQSGRPGGSKRSPGHQRAASPPPLRHFGAAAPGQRWGSLQNWIQQEFEALDEILRGLAAVGELTPRTNDLVVSFGERLSSRLVAEVFARSGYSCGARRCTHRAL